MIFALGSSAHIVLLRPRTPAVICLLVSWTKPAIYMSRTEGVVFMR